MQYSNIVKGTFIDRPNRFIANLILEGKNEVCHVKNTGRCAELFLPGSIVYAEYCDKPDRKTKWDLIAVKKGENLVNVDSQVPNKLVEEWIREGNFLEKITYIKTEKTYKNSRFDLYLETNDKKIFIEVKGVTLEEDSVAMFPDAPTERGVKHILELCECVKEGYEAYVFFVIQMKGIRVFSPNEKRHKAFAEALRYAQSQGVHILAYDCEVYPDRLKIDCPVEVVLC